jgi:hypothetical protein
VLQAQGHLAAARPLYERALVIREKTLGPEHPEVARDLNNLAVLLKDQGDLAGARPLGSQPGPAGFLRLDRSCPPSKARTIDRPNEFQIRGWPD